MSLQADKQKRRWLLPLLTAFIMLVIIGTAGAMRVRIDTKELRVPTEQGNITTFQEAKLFMAERMILATLSKDKQISDYQPNQEDSTYSVFIKTLINYVDASEITLDLFQSELLEDKIVELVSIMNIEKESDFTKMSLDGRAVAIDIAGQIYNQCGLRLITGMEGSIEKILDKAGNVIYSDPSYRLPYNFQPGALVATLAAIISLLWINLMIGKKNNLYQKEAVYNEFDEKRFA